MSSRVRRRRRSRARHDASVGVDGVRPAPALEARGADRGVDGVRGFLLVVEVADRARLAGRVGVVRLPPPLSLGPGHTPELRREPRERPQVDATGALVPKRAAVIAPDPARAPTETTSKFWGVHWRKSTRRWQAQYKDADGKTRFLGLYDTQEAAAHAVNAGIRRAGLAGKRRMNPVVDGRLVPRARKTTKKRRRDEPAATPPPRARRPRRAVNYDDSEADADDDEDLELAPADDEDGWD